MFGGFIGQYLPVTGGTMLGNLSMGSFDLSGIVNLKDAGGNAFLIANNGDGFAVGPAGMYLDTSNTMLLSGDQTGNITIEGGGSFDITAAGTFSGANPLLVVSPMALSGTVTVSSAVSVAGVASNLTIAGGTTTGKEFIHVFQLGGNAKSAIFKDGTACGISFSANVQLCVDVANGNDTSGSGARNNPFKTIAHACSVATSGNCIILMPGTYNERVVLPAGVSLIGSGPGVTTIQFTGNSPEGIVLVPGNGSYVAHLTLLRPRGSGGAGGAPVGFNTGTDTVAQNAMFFNVVFSGDFDNVYCLDPSPPAYTSAGNWTSGTAYSANQWVLYGPMPYVCTTSLTSTTIPPQDSAHWTPLVYWTFRSCTFLSSWDCTNLSYPMFADFFDCFFDQGPNQYGYNGIGSALQPGNVNCRVRAMGCKIRQVATSGAGGGTAFNANSSGIIEVHATSVVTNNQIGTAVMNAIQVGTSGSALSVVKIGGGCSFDVSAYSQVNGGIIQGVASGAMFPTSSNPKDATPANRPPGVVGSIAVYSGGFYLCTNETTPTYVQINVT